jgi:opacity protein-like surface antigen
MKLRNLASVGFAAALLATGASAQENRGGTYLGVRAGMFMPSNGEMRDIFGSSIFVLGLSADDFTKQADKWRLTADFDFITGKEDNNKFFIAPVTASIGRVFGSPDDNMRPFVRFGVGGAYMDYSITRPSTAERFSAKRFGFGADAEVGVFLSDRVRVSAKYLWFSKVDDFDFSGLTLTATVNIFKF